MTGHPSERRMDATKVLATRDDLNSAISDEIRELVLVIAKASLSQGQKVPSKKFLEKKVTRLDAQKIVQDVLRHLQWVDDDSEAGE